MQFIELGSINCEGRMQNAECRMQNAECRIVEEFCLWQNSKCLFASAKRLHSLYIVRCALCIQISVYRNDKLKFEVLVIISENLRVIG